VVEGELNTTPGEFLPLFSSREFTCYCSHSAETTRTADELQFVRSVNTGGSYGSSNDSYGISSGKNASRTQGDRTTPLLHDIRIHHAALILVIRSKINTVPRLRVIY